MGNEQPMTWAEVKALFTPMDQMVDPNDVYCSIGLLVMSFQELEHEYSEFLTTLIDAPRIDLADILITKMSFKNMLEVLVTVCKGANVKEEHFEKLSALVGRSMQHEQDRNQYVHSHYDLIEMQLDKVRYSRSKHTISRKKGFQRHSEIFDPKKLNEVSDDIFKTISELYPLKDEILMDLLP
jgi:hypothetical protein